jgi:hypothetical protein
MKKENTNTLSGQRTQGGWVANGQEIKDSTGHGICRTYAYPPFHENVLEAQANAAYICEAVNNYSSLKEENERLKEALKQIADCRGLNLDSSGAKGFTIIAEKALKQ